MPIRRRLVLYAAGIATAGMILFGSLLTGLAASGVASDQVEALGRLATDTAAAIEADPSRLGAGAPLLVADLATSLEPFVVVATETGEIRYATGQLGGQPPRIPAAVIVEALEAGSSDADIRLLDQDFAIHAVRLEAGGQVGVAVAGQTFAFRTQQIIGFRVFLVLSAVVTIVAVVLVTRVVVGRALRPLRTAAATADDIARTGDLNRRLPAVRPRDEVAMLSTSFNGMLDRLAATQERLAGTLTAQRRFAADASHELRTPLTTIRTNAEFLATHGDADPTDRTEALADIAGEAERMSRLVDDLLMLARNDSQAAASPEPSPSPPLDVRRPVDLGALVADVARRARRPDREIVIARVPADPGVPGHPGGAGSSRATPDVAAGSSGGAIIVEGDPAELERLVWILVDNALRHGDGTVTVSLEAGDRAAILRVADVGPGIPAGMEDRVFDRFVRADPARSGSGSGLGLAIARSIVDRHGGSISAASRAPVDGGRGALFTVTLPMI